MRVNGLECEERNRNDKAVKEQEIGWRVSGGGFFFLIFFLPGALPPDGTCATNRSTSNLQTGRCRQFHKKKKKFIFSIAIGTSQWKTTWKWHYSQNSKKKKLKDIFYLSRHQTRFLISKRYGWQMGESYKQEKKRLCPANLRGFSCCLQIWRLDLASWSHRLFRTLERIGSEPQTFKQFMKEGKVLRLVGNSHR